MPGVKEDVTDLILNIKELVVSSEHDEPVVMYLRKQGPGDVTAADIAPPAGVEVHNPELHIATAERQGQARDRAHRRAWPWLRLRRAEQAGRPGDRPDPGRLDLLAGPQGHLQGRGDPCRAAHRLRPADRRRRDQAVDAPARRGRAAPARPWSSCSAWPASSTSTPRASTWARRRPTRRWRPTSRSRSRSWTSRSGRTTASSARASTPWASSSPAARPTCSTSATSARSRSTRSRPSWHAMGLALKDSPPGFDPGCAVDSYGDRRRRRPRRFAEDEQL